LAVLLAQALPTLWINAERLNTVHARETHERPAIGSGSIAKQAREQGECVIGQCRIDERFLTVESLGCATARETISIKVSLSCFGEEFRNSAQPQSVPPIPSIQRFSKDKLPAIGVVAKVQPIINFAPVFGAFSNRCSRFPRIDTPDHNIHTIQPSFGVEPFRNSLPVEAPEQI
jgi:hypothetical protein